MTFQWHPVGMVRKVAASFHPLEISYVVYPHMSSTTDLQRWVRAQYQALGVDQKGHFIGKKRFKNRLVEPYPTINGEKVPKQEIRRMVNR